MGAGVVSGRSDGDFRLRLPVQRQVEISGKDLPPRAIVEFYKMAF
jgi:hypothetical protein